MSLYPGVFEFRDTLRSATPEILKEVEEILEKRRGKKVGWHGDTSDGSIVDGTWKEVVLFGRGPTPELAPVTAALIKDCMSSSVDYADVGGGEVILSFLEGGSKINMHCATTDHRLTVHLGLVVPEEGKGRCEIKVGEEWYNWSVGECLVFDDSYQHEVINSTSETRVILLIRMPHPDLRDGAEGESITRMAEENRERQYENRWEYLSISVSVPSGCHSVHSSIVVSTYN